MRKSIGKRSNILCSLVFCTMFAMLGTLSSCSKAVVVPSYGDNYTPFRFAAYMTPPPANSLNYGNKDFQTEEYYADMKAAGFDYAYAIFEDTAEETIKALALCEKFKIKYYVRENEIMWAIIGKDITELAPDVIQRIKTNVDQYTKYESFAGIVAGDEISMSQFNNAKVVKTWWEKEYPGKDFFINLLPLKASPAQLGTRKYQEHLDKFIERTNPSLMSFDDYSLMGPQDSEKYIHSNHLINLEMVANTAKKANIPYFAFLLTMGHYGYRTPDNYDDNAWQVYSSMAYGFTGLQTFTYWTTLDDDPTIIHGCIDKAGNKTKVYYALQEVIAEVRAMEKVFMQFEYKGTMVKAANTEIIHPQMSLLKTELESHPRISGYTASEDILIGTFMDKDKNDGFMLVNYADPYFDKSNSVKITFKDAKEVLVLAKGKTTQVKLKKGVYETTLGSGEGQFVIPLK